MSLGVSGDAESIRRCAVRGTMTVVSPSRKGAARHLKSTQGELPELDGRCPFCPGHEADTEPTVDEYPNPPAPHRVRAVRNKFPLVHTMSKANGPGTGHPPIGATSHEWCNHGVHEVLIEGAVHDAELEKQPHAQVVALLSMFQRRYRALRAMEGVNSVAIFRNRGRRAGSSQPHPHAQVIALPVVTPDEFRADELALASYRAHGRTAWATAREEATRAGRVVLSRGAVTAFAPFAPSHNHEVWMGPSSEGAHADFAGVDPETIDTLASCVQQIVRAVRETAALDYNLVLRLPRLDALSAPHAFWFLAVMPRAQGAGAGFELSTGMHVVTVTPERAAEQLRNALG